MIKLSILTVKKLKYFQIKMNNEAIQKIYQKLSDLEDIRDKNNINPKHQLNDPSKPANSIIKNI